MSLIVIERFMIWPENNIYILPKTSLSFELAVIKNENHLMFFESLYLIPLFLIIFLINISKKEIILPNKNYVWSNQDQSLGAIQNDGIFMSHEKEGVTEIIVKDISNKKTKYFFISSN